MRRLMASDICGMLNPVGTCMGEDVEVAGITADSRRVRPGYIFAVIHGTQADGADYIEDARRRGAAVLLCGQQHGSAGCQIIVDDVRTAFAQAAAIIAGEPSRSMLTIGVTGTNGKTTVTHMIRDVLTENGRECGLLGTIACEFAGRRIAAERTTPDAATLQETLRQMREAGCSAVVMEVSSHALDQKRVVGVDFNAAVFTNLTHEHLDYHGSMEAYYNAKALLFRELKDAAVGVVNTDDKWGQRLSEEGLACSVMSYGMNGAADFMAVDVELDVDGSRFRLVTPSGSFAAKLRLLGRHNISNALACAAVCKALGISEPEVLDVLAQMNPVRGRMEPVPVSDDFAVFVDYAHTGDALEHALRTVREITAGRVIVVFGCGGDRDREKRPEMGRIAAEAADIVVVTSDNPRGEDPESIIDEIMEGISSADAHVERVSDRAEAIALALGLADCGDSVLIAGKGHETYQEAGGRRIHFDDRERALAAAGICGD